MMYRCSLTNEKGQGTAEAIVHGEKNALEIKVWKRPTFVSETLQLNCKAELDEYSQLGWRFKSHDYPNKPLLNGTEFQIEDDVQLIKVPAFYNNFKKNSRNLIAYHQSYSTWTTLRIENVTQKHVGQYICECVGDPAFYVCPYTETYEQLPVEIPNVRIIKMTKRKLKEKTLVSCFFEGKPPPTVEWLVNREPVNLTQSERLIGQNYSTLLFNQTYGGKHLSDETAITCVVGQGKERRSIHQLLEQIEWEKFEKKSTTWVIAVWILVFLSISVFVGFKLASIRMARKKRKIGYAFYKDGRHFNLLEELKSNSGLNDYPYLMDLMFPEERIQLGQVLGEGAFGKVVKATAVGIDGDGKVKQVAVKMARNEYDEEQQKALVSEVSSMGLYSQLVIISYDCGVFELINASSLVKNNVILGTSRECDRSSGRGCIRL